MDEAAKTAGVPDGQVTDQLLLALRQDLMRTVDDLFPENDRLKAVAKTQFDLGFGSLLLLRAE